jgi:predicted MFS family arabinose efflux permease
VIRDQTQNRVHAQTVAPAATPNSTQALPRGTLWLMALACGASAANIYYNQPLLGNFARQFQASPVQVGWIAFAAQAGYGLGLLFFLPLGDRLERRRLVLWIVQACAALLAATAFMPTLPWLIWLHLAVGMTSMSAQILIPLGVELSPPAARGHTVGVLMAGLLGGILLARTLSGFIGDRFGWRYMYGLAALIMAVLSFWLRAGLPHTEPAEQLPYHRLMLSLWHVLKSQPRLWPASLISGLTFGSFTAFWTTLSFLMIAEFHRGASAAGAFGVIGLVGALAAPLAGKLSDRMGAHVTVTLALVASLVAFVLMWAWVSIASLVVGVLLMDVGVQSVQVAEQAKVISLLPSARSRLNTIYMVTRFVGGALGSMAAASAWSLAKWPGVCATALAFTAASWLIHIAARFAESRKLPLVSASSV